MTIFRCEVGIVPDCAGRLYFNMVSQMKSLVDKWFGRIVLFALLGPFAVVYLFGIFGMSMPEVNWFGIWFMGALTVSGAVMTFEVFKSAKAHGPSELGCALPLTAITCWLGYVFLKELGVTP